MIDIIDIIYVVSKQVFNENYSYIYCAFRTEKEAIEFCKNMNDVCVNGVYDYEEIEIVGKE